MTTPELINRSRIVLNEMLKYRGFDDPQLSSFVPVLKPKEVPTAINSYNATECISIRYVSKSKFHLEMETVIIGLLGDWKETHKNKMYSAVFILNDEPSPQMLDAARLLYKKHHVFIQLIPITRLSFNITSHRLVPEHVRISEQQLKSFEADFLDAFHIDSLEKIPKILDSDPVALFIGLRPNELCKITRNTTNSGHHVAYRYCISG